MSTHQTRMKQPGLSTMHENNNNNNNTQPKTIMPQQQTYKPDSFDQIPKSTTTTTQEKNNNQDNFQEDHQKPSNNAIPSTTQSSLETNNNNKPTGVKDILANFMKERKEREADGTHHTGKIRITVRNHIKDSKMAGTTSTKTTSECRVSSR